MPEIEIWSIENCPRCETVKLYLKSRTLTFTEKSLAALRSGDIKDDEALVELAINRPGSGNDGVAPLIRYDGNFVTESELKMLIVRSGHGNA